MNKYSQTTAIQMRMQDSSYLYLLCCMLLLLTAFTSAANAEVVSNLEGYLVQTDEEGKEVFAPAEVAEPGFLIEYRLSFKNAGEKSAKDLVVIGPIPANTHYKPNTANTQVRNAFWVSIDNGDSWEAEPVTRVRVLADGTKETYVIPPEQYTHLKWETKERLGAGETHEYKYRVIVD